MVLITNVFERALALLASQFRDQKLNGELTNLQKLIKILSVPAQELQYLNEQLLTERWLNIAVGVQLDELGIILGLPRNPGESDNDYRERLQFQIFINISNGTPEDVIRALAFLTKSTHIDYIERSPAFFQMGTDGLTFPEPPNELNDAIFAMSPAGVNYAPIIATYGAEIPFEFSGDLSSTPFGVSPDISDPSFIAELLIEPQNDILYVSAGDVEDTGPNGGLDELDFPLPTAGQVSELIQKNGNFPPERFI